MDKSELWLKLRLLLAYFPNVKAWREDVWRHEARERMCCNGHMCGCQGSDYWSYWEHLLKRKTQ